MDITSNKNHLFISNYEKTLILLWKIRVKLTIIYYPKIDKKIKKTNWSIKYNI